MNTPPSKQLDQFVVRFPDGLRDRIKDAAAASNRSMNAEIVAALEEKYPAYDDDQFTVFREVVQNAPDAKLRQVFQKQSKPALNKIQQLYVEVMREGMRVTRAERAPEKSIMPGQFNLDIDGNYRPGQPGMEGFEEDDRSKKISSAVEKAFDERLAKNSAELKKTIEQFFQNYLDHHNASKDPDQDQLPENDGPRMG